MRVFAIVAEAKDNPGHVRDGFAKLKENHSGDEQTH
jgi:hypothetical protein